MNRLGQEKSPYLQQHAANPVDWFAWGSEAFDAARELDLPIFLSIGYSTCHWCHVMERESFESETIARQMNEMFVNVKVDREERPDVDAIYMGAAQALTGQGGWPLSVWLTPEGLPFYAGTYFPPEPRYGRPSFPQVLTALSEAWRTDRERVERSASTIAEALRRGAIPSDADRPGIDIDNTSDNAESIARNALEKISVTFDEDHGGFGGAPKFPRPALLFFLLDILERVVPIKGDGSNEAPDGRSPRTMIEATLRGMCNGGIYDHLGGGFSRYSVDGAWRVPHFEKMLYDQAQLLDVLGRFHRLAPDRRYVKRMTETIDYLDRDLAAPGGGYHAAEDADSEGVEGKFYVWKPDELVDVLGADDAEIAARWYGVTDEGNFEGYSSVLYRPEETVDLATGEPIATDEYVERIPSIRQRLFDARSRRIRPSLDTKIVTAWNGLLISGFVRAGVALEDDLVIDRAERLADWMLENLVDSSGDLVRRIVDGEAAFRATLDDYAFVIRGLLDLYDVRLDLRHIASARRLLDRAIELFADETGGGFFLSDGTDPHLPIRSKGDQDGAEPAGNSVMAANLTRLSTLLGRTDYRDRAERTWRLFSDRIADYPDAMPMMVSVGIELTHPQSSIVIVEHPDDGEGAERLVDEARGLGQRASIVRIRTDDDTEALLQASEHLRAIADAEHTTSVAYLCSDFVCQAPTASLRRLHNEDRES